MDGLNGKSSSDIVERVYGAFWDSESGTDSGSGEGTTLANEAEVNGRRKKDPRALSPLTLAYIGDTIYDLYVRTYLIENTDCTAHGLHMHAKNMVNARAQARAFLAVEAKLTEEELKIYKHGRNAHIGVVPPHTTIGDYRAATGLEALLGHLYLQGRDERMAELMGYAIRATTSL